MTQRDYTLHPLTTEELQAIHGRVEAAIELEQQIQAVGPSEPELIFCGVRGGDFGMADDDWQLECRFVDGQKYAAVHVSLDFEQLALDIAAWLNERALQRGHGHREDKTRAARYQALEVLGDALRDWRIHAIAEQHANAVAFSLTACLAEMVKALVKEKKIAVENKGLF